MIYRFAVGRLSCAVVSDGQMEPPLAPPLEAFFTPGTGVPEGELRAAVATEGQGRTMLRCGYNCLLVETPDGRAVIDTGLGPRFGGYGPQIRHDVTSLRFSLGWAPQGFGDMLRTARTAARGELGPPRGRC